MGNLILQESKYQHSLEWVQNWKTGTHFAQSLNHLQGRKGDSKIFETGTLLGNNGLNYQLVSLH